jgi:hypothetical protein
LVPLATVTVASLLAVWPVPVIVPWTPLPVSPSTSCHGAVPSMNPAFAVASTLVAPAATHTVCSAAGEAVPPATETVHQTSTFFTVNVTGVAPVQAMPELEVEVEVELELVVVPLELELELVVVPLELELVVAPLLLLLEDVVVCEPVLELVAPPPLPPPPPHAVTPAAPMRQAMLTQAALFIRSSFFLTLGYSTTS